MCGGALRPENLCYIGVRSYEAAEWRCCAGSACASSTWRRCSSAACGLPRRSPRHRHERHRGFGLTIDLDGFDPEDVPGIGLKCPDGLRAAETCAALKTIADHPAMKAIEIVEYIPEFDEDFRTAYLSQRYDPAERLVAKISPGTSQI